MLLIDQEIIDMAELRAQILLSRATNEITVSTISVLGLLIWWSTRLTNLIEFEVQLLMRSLWKIIIRFLTPILCEKGEIRTGILILVNVVIILVIGRLSGLAYLRKHYWNRRMNATYFECIFEHF